LVGLCIFRSLKNFIYFDRICFMVILNSKKQDRSQENVEKSTYDENGATGNFAAGGKFAELGRRGRIGLKMLLLWRTHL
jgi:hypothetical protein